MPKVITLTHILVGGGKTLTERNIIYFSCRAAEARSFAGVVSTLVVGCRCRRCTHKEAGPWRKGFWYGGLVTHARCGAGRLAGGRGSVCGGAGTKTKAWLTFWTSGRSRGGRRGEERGLRLNSENPSPPARVESSSWMLEYWFTLSVLCLYLIAASFKHKYTSY